MQLLHLPLFKKWGQTSPGYFSYFSAGFSGYLYLKPPGKSPYEPFE